ncbi:type I DNA topoisomerase [Stenotrophomonas maltophilia]|uniref:type I DNA topoisomerase n=1 Tax=Stenotrophomonas maltophilia TaxID=40324 RepID=UPI00313D418C
MDNLVILESPNKTAKIQSYLGAGWKVVASKGHIRDLPLRDLGVDESTYELQYEMTDRSRSVVAALKNLAAQSGMVYLATDPDREGEAIAWHLKDAIGLSDSQCVRVTFNELAAGAVAAAIANPRAVDMPLVYAQEARRAADRLVGYLVSPTLWDSVGQGASAGRVQSVAVRLVYDREKEIKGFKSTKHFTARLGFEGGKWSAEWQTASFLQPGVDYVLERSLAEAAARCSNLVVVGCEVKEQAENPPPPFNSASLMKAAGPRLGFSPETVAELAQKLFEGRKEDETGHISYHRTDTVNLSAGSNEEIRRYAREQGWPVPDKPRKFKEKEGAQAGHEAIRPTHLDASEAGTGSEEQALYRLIWERAVASQLEAAGYKVTTLVLEGEVDGRKFTFKASSRVLVRPGWRVLASAAAAAEEDGDPDAADCGQVPHLAEGQSVRADAGQVVDKATRAPSRYTKSSLVDALEARGIGRPSTYAAISRNITERGYVLEKGRQLYMEALGNELIEALLAGRFGFMEYEFTRDLEERLDAIASGTRSYESVVGEVHSALVRDLGNVAAQGLVKPKFACPDCGRAMRRRKGEKGIFWGCTGYRDTENPCKTMMDDSAGKPVPRLSHPCPDCTKPMYRRKGSSGHFWGCSGYTDGCKVTLPDVKGKPGKRPAPSEHKCECGHLLVRRTKASTKAKKGYDFYGCTGYPGCNRSYGVGDKGVPVPRGGA